jgi:predicted XRE-type DNA-binding protein
MVRVMMMSDDGTNSYPATFAREELEERIAHDEVETTKDAAMLPKAHFEVERYLSRIYDDPSENKAYKLVHSDGIAKGVRRGVEENDSPRLAYFRGYKDGERDVSGIKSLTRLFKIITSPGGRILYVFGNQGAGKTDFVVLVGEMLHEFMGVEVHTNIKSATENRGGAYHFDDVEGLKEAIRKDERTFIILDEASRLLRGENHHEVIEAFQGDLHSLRKSDSNIVLIGHSGKDIDPLFRALATFVHKEGRERVTLYEGARVTTEGRVDGYGELLSLSGIPPTNWDFDTDEESTFSMSEDTGAEYTEKEVENLLEDEIREYRNGLMPVLYQETDLSQNDIADLLGVTQARVNQVINQ